MRRLRRARRRCAARRARAPEVARARPTPPPIAPARGRHDRPASDRPRRPRSAARARLRPEALAAARGGAREGLDWLGRPPEARRLAPLPARPRWSRGSSCSGCSGSGSRHRARSTCRRAATCSSRRPIAAGWIRSSPCTRCRSSRGAWFLGSGPSTFTSRWRESLIHRLGGLLPVWRGGVGIERHVRSARAVVEAGAVFVQMPEGTVNGPPGRLGPFRPGAALIALRTGAPIVPLAMAGTEELYLGRRMASRVLPPTTVARAARRGLGRRPAGAGLARGAGARSTRQRRAGGEDRPGRRGALPGTVDPPGRPRRLRRRLTWLLLGPGPLEH